MPTLTQPALKPRKTPIQARSNASVDAILQATLQVLTSVGKERLTTTRVAARAGVSVGTLYQYFPNKSALLQACLRHHMEQVRRSIETVCRAKSQFSCWNPGDPNRAKLLAVDDSDPAFRVAKAVAAEAVAGRLTDPTYGATTYKVASLPWPYAWGRPRLPLTEIGRHAFYTLLED